jgi:glutathione-regulated potassium-efflux system protein KefB
VFLESAFVYLLAAVVAVLVATRLGLGSVLGYLAAGVVLGPSVLGLGGDAREVFSIAEFGVVLLLFLVGLELEPRRLLELRGPVFGLGSLQVLATATAVAPLALALGLPWQGAVVAGMGLALSSTALALQLLAERNEVATPHGRSAFGILLFQDLAVIPMLAILPLLGTREAAGPEAAGWLVAAKAAAAVAGVVLGGRFVARPVLRFVARARSPELFTATALLLVAGTALAVHAAGLSMALGAFLAGVLLAGSEYRHELEADIAPFKGLLLGLFFVAVGMGANVRMVLDHPGEVLADVAGLVLVKGAVGAAIGWWALRSKDGALSLAVLLSQGGEFAFVLFALAASQGALDPRTADLLVVTVTLSMATTPALYALLARVVRPRLARGPARAFDVAPDAPAPVIVAGFGRVGQVVGRVLRAKKIPFTAMDASSEHIDFIRKFGNQVFFGDASRLDLLRAARADAARIFVLAIDDVEASLRTAEVVRAHFPHLVILARARNRQHAYRLRGLGITRVIRETFAGSLELTGGVLEVLGLEQADVRLALDRFRAHDEELLERTFRHAGDTDKLVEVAKQGRAELERLFEGDAAERRSA